MPCMAEEVGIDRKHEEGSGMKLRDGKGVGFRHVGVPERITRVWKGCGEVWKLVSSKLSPVEDYELVGVR